MPLQIVRRDIVTMAVDAIVNTTNAEMVGYSGVDLLVHEKAGPELDALCADLAPLELGFAKITPGFNLPCKHIIHTFGPTWDGGSRGERAILKSCYEECLKLAVKNNCQSVAFPLISSGFYGYPKDQVLTYAVAVISEFLQAHELDVYLCVWDRTSYEFSRTLFSDISRFIDRHHTVPAMARPSVMPTANVMARKVCVGSLSDYLQKMDKGFSETLLDLIDKTGKKDSEIYKKANISKQHFSKIRNNPGYKPTKPTAVALALALELDLDEMEDLIGRAGYALTNSSKFDLIVRYFIEQGNYDIFQINEALFEFDQMLLGV